MGSTSNTKASRTERVLFILEILLLRLPPAVQAGDDWIIKYTLLSRPTSVTQSTLMVINPLTIPRGSILVFAQSPQIGALRLVKRILSEKDDSSQSDVGIKVYCPILYFCHRRRPGVTANHPKRHCEEHIRFAQCKLRDEAIHPAKLFWIATDPAAPRDDEIGLPPIKQAQPG